MKTFTTRRSLQQYLQQIKTLNKTIGFVPTLGALHQGHLSLIEFAQQQNDVIVCSIFVNPSQFNDPKDLEKYPRTIEADIKMLEQVNCDILFNPEVNEMYDGNEQWHLNIGETEHLLEGEFRPGHYQGVTQVVNKLFGIVNPDTAYFGQKDYQQFLIISKMVNMLNMPVKLVMCPIKRETNGLAMSSRNIHLTPGDRQHALVLSKTLNWLSNNFNQNNIPALKKEAEQMINAEPGVELDYFEIADGDTLHPANDSTKSIVALVAAKVGKTRLIDNILLSPKS
ncbi:pantoate--beta-alanine ligase [Mucilaginibacter sp.]|uniref:pantoate--beta-alanine ligase n=1 Tax=Mucilaginibacter sp. TaxID=1882438 RepID=UPI002633CE74|nr:pantoate--beta-alanine ligase [Mucilaginibacter sp.]MDB4918613.1 pantoate--beta-alanine ligase [Mucilaginibacter sp.]